MDDSKKKKKRGSVSGFDGVGGAATSRRIKLWEKNQPAGRWRKVQLIKIQYTYLEQTWTYVDKHFKRIQVCPWGMREFMKKRFKL